jgi:hypothetical protein
VTFRSAASRDSGGPRATAAADRETLRAILSAGERRLRADNTKLLDSCKALQLSVGRDPAPVLAALDTLGHGLNTDIRKLKAARLHTARGRTAQRLAIRTLTLLDSGVTALRSAFSATDSSRSEHWIAQAKQHVTQAQRERAKASRALGFTWQL